MSLQEVTGAATPDCTDKSLPFTQVAFIVSNSFVLSLGIEESHIARFLPLFSRCGGSDVVALTRPVNHIRDRIGKSSVQGGICIVFLLQDSRNPSLGLSGGTVWAQSWHKAREVIPESHPLDIRGSYGMDAPGLSSLLPIRSKGPKGLLEHFSFILHSFIGQHLGITHFVLSRALC